MNKKKSSVFCPASVLYDVIEEDLQSELCSDITFLCEGTKHRIGVWGDDGNSVKNVHYYFDRGDWFSLEELKQHASVGGVLLTEYKGLVEVLVCNGCYPRSTPLLDAWYQEMDAKK